MSAKHEVSPENAPLFLEWIRSRGGIAVWNSADLSNPGASWSTPAETNGKPTSKPGWQSESKPARVITDANDVVVVSRKEVKRFRVAIRSGRNSLRFRITDGSQRKLDNALEKAGDGSSYEFDYSTQEAVVFAVDGKVSLAEWKSK